MKHPNTGLRDVLATAADITRTADRANIEIRQASAGVYRTDNLIEIHIADPQRAADLIEALDVEVEKVQNFPDFSAQTVTVNESRVIVYGAPIVQVAS